MEILSIGTVMATPSHEHFNLRASLSDRCSRGDNVTGGSNCRLYEQEGLKNSGRCYGWATTLNKRELGRYILRNSSFFLRFMRGTGSQSMLDTSQWLRRPGKRRILRDVEVSARLLDPVIFDASKLRVDFMDAVSPADVAYPHQLLPRHYTLTHHDVTAELQLSIGSLVNENQLNGWYTRLLRDEVVAEWRTNEHEPESLSLHVHCHISGGQVFFAPAALRDWIFRREMPLVLKAFRHGDSALFEMHPGLEFATVWVHYHSVDAKYDRADCWGSLRQAVSRLKSQDKLVSQTNLVSQNNLVSQSTLVSRNNLVSPNNLVLQDNLVSQNKLVSQKNLAPRDNFDLQDKYSKYSVSSEDHLQASRRSGFYKSKKKQEEWMEDLEVIPDFSLEEAHFLSHDGQDLVGIVEDRSTPFKSEVVH